MHIYKQNDKIVVALNYTDVLFNNSEKEGPLIEVDSSALDDVNVYVPPSQFILVFIEFPHVFLCIVYVDISAI